MCDEPGPAVPAAVRNGHMPRLPLARGIESLHRLLPAVLLGSLFLGPTRSGDRSVQRTSVANNIAFWYLPPYLGCEQERINAASANRLQ